MGYVRRLATFDQNVEVLTLDSATTVAHSGGTEDINIRPPDGYIYRLLNLYMRAVTPGGTGSGTHILMLRDNADKFRYLYGEGAHNTTVEYNYGYWTQAGTTKIPTDNHLAAYNMRSAQASYDNYLIARYQNSTDVDQTNSRLIRAHVLKTKVF